MALSEVQSTVTTGRESAAIQATSSVAGGPGKTMKAQKMIEEVAMNLCSAVLQALFEDRNTIPERMFDKITNLAKRVIRGTEADKEVR